jgi:Na+/H+ antiporter
MSAVAVFDLILFLMAVALLLELLAGRLRMPPAAAFILGGGILALIPGVPNIEFDPNLVLVLFLPPLLMSSAFFTSWRDFRSDLRIILALSVGAVVFTTFLVGVVAHWVAPFLPWAACFALGAILSPPDAVAAKAVLQRLPLPPRLVMVLEAESLVNDASGLVLYRFAVAAALTGAFSAREAAATFAILAFGGVAVGTAFGFATSWLMRALRNSLHAIVTSFLVAWASYIFAERIGVSGVLSTVTCGMIIGVTQHSHLSAGVRTQAKAVWEVVEFVMESFIFVLIGLSLRGILDRLGGGSADLIEMLPATAAIVGTVIVGRFAWVFWISFGPRLLRPILLLKEEKVPFPVQVVMGWAGMRGVVSLAAALALPQGFPGRDFILAVTFAVIVVTVLVQGGTLAPLVRLLRVDRYASAPSQAIGEAAARAQVFAAQFAAVQRHSLQPDGTHRHPRLMHEYSYRSLATRNFAEDVEGHLGHRDEHFHVVLAAVAAGRAELLRLHSGDEIHDSVLRAIELDLDLQELSAQHWLRAH